MYLYNGSPGLLLEHKMSLCPWLLLLSPSFCPRVGWQAATAAAAGLEQQQESARELSTTLPCCQA
jgi:hypothetical protein